MSLLLVCLIVNDTCNPLEHPFPIRITGDNLGCELAEAIKLKNPDRLGHIDSSDLTLWKPNAFFPGGPRNVFSYAQDLHLNASQN
ncbi:hypothetical protein B0F90DRAFT_301251 [Multifurca ochricompacta]|uniref:Crinkler effector protein N-terminal domain-containing protein n=1 Tax=Multifurca ochricompacta TaxID=376703 RepID=A0AAD4QJG9_9AGAM|nr:hypothetical protein B0F90DRAFT_301251 [Multifurca ochricompacta]